MDDDQNALDDQKALREAARGFLDQVCASPAVRAAIDTPDGYDPAVWWQMVEMGWSGLLIPSALGGADATFAEAMVIAREIGASVVPGPFLASGVLAASLLRTVSNPRAGAVLGAIAEGDALATVALTGPDGRWRGPTQPPPARAETSGDSWTLTGTFGFVPELASADQLVVAASLDGDYALFLLDAAAPGVGRAAVKLFDLTRRLGTLELSGVALDASSLLARGAEAEVLAGRAARRTKLALAADAIGAAARAQTLAVAYAKQRVQFDRPIGSFQAVKHKLANMFVTVEASGAAVEQASEPIDTEPDSRLIDSAIAFVLDGAVTVAGDAVQVHGGIGFTWEHDCHLLLKRTLLDEALLGDAALYRESAAGSLLPAGAS